MYCNKTNMEAEVSFILHIVTLIITYCILESISSSEKYDLLAIIPLYTIHAVVVDA